MNTPLIYISARRQYLDSYPKPVVFAIQPRSYDHFFFFKCITVRKIDNLVSYSRTKFGYKHKTYLGNIAKLGAVYKAICDRAAMLP